MTFDISLENQPVWSPLASARTKLLFQSSKLVLYKSGNAFQRLRSLQLFHYLGVTFIEASLCCGLFLVIIKF